jgi:hypothetical protein
MGLANLTKPQIAYQFDNLNFTWLIRVMWLIWGSKVHRINHEAQNNHDLLSDRPHTRLSGTTQHDSITGVPTQPATGRTGRRRNRLPGVSNRRARPPPGGACHRT